MYTTWQMTHVFNIRPMFPIMHKLQQEARLGMFLLFHSCDTEFVGAELCQQWGKGFGLGKKKYLDFSFFCALNYIFICFGSDSFY